MSKIAPSDVDQKKKNIPPIKRWAQKKGLTPAELADGSGLGYSTIIKWFAGTKPRRGSRLVFIAAYPDCEI